MTCPTGAPQAGVCQPRVPGSFSSSHGCADPGQDGIRVTELQAGTPGSSLRPGGCWPHLSVLALLLSTGEMGYCVSCCPLLTGGMWSPKSPFCRAVTATGPGMIPRSSPSVLGQECAPCSFGALAWLYREDHVPVPATSLDSGMGHIPSQKSNKDVGFGVLPLGNELECSWLVGV